MFRRGLSAAGVGDADRVRECHAKIGFLRRRPSLRSPRGGSWGRRGVAGGGLPSHIAGAAGPTGVGVPRRRATMTSPGGECSGPTGGSPLRGPALWASSETLVSPALPPLLWAGRAAGPVDQLGDCHWGAGLAGVAGPLPAERPLKLSARLFNWLIVPGRSSNSTPKARTISSNTWKTDFCTRTVPARENRRDPNTGRDYSGKASSIATATPTPLAQTTCGTSAYPGKGMVHATRSLRCPTSGGSTLRGVPLGPERQAARCLSLKRARGSRGGFCVFRDYNCGHGSARCSV